MKVNVHIERLVLEGLPVSGREGEHVAELVRVELAELVALRAVSPSLLSGPAVPLLQADTIQVGAPVGPQPLGQRIAQAVHGVIAK